MEPRENDTMEPLEVGETGEDEGIEINENPSADNQEVVTVSHLNYLDHKISHLNYLDHLDMVSPIK